MSRAVYTSIIILFCLLPLTAWAGSIDSPAAPDDAASAMFTVDDIYNRINTGINVSKRGASFEEPLNTPSSTQHTLDEVMSVAPVPDNVNGASPADVDCGKTFWSLRTDGSWGQQVGTYRCPR